MSASGRGLVSLTRYAAWANQRLYRSLATLPERELVAPRAIFAGSILRTLNHVHLIDVVWQSHLRGVPHGFATRNPESTPAFDALRQAQAEIDTWYVDYADALSPERQAEAVRFTFIGGGEGTMTRGDILYHVVNHVTYHRGHITAMMFEVGVEPPVTDFPVFLRDVDHATAG